MYDWIYDNGVNNFVPNHPCITLTATPKGSLQAMLERKES